MIEVRQCKRNAKHTLTIRILGILEFHKIRALELGRTKLVDGVGSKKQESIVFMLGHLIYPVLWHFGTEMLSLCVEEDIWAKRHVGKFARSEECPRSMWGNTWCHIYPLRGGLRMGRVKRLPEDKELITGA